MSTCEGDELKHVQAVRIIKSQSMLLIYAILSEFCVQLSEQMNVLSSSRFVPERLRPTVDSVMFCAHRLEIDELHRLKYQMKLKFQDTWYQGAVDNDHNTVNYKIVELFNQRPNEIEIRETIEKYSRRELQTMDRSSCRDSADEWYPTNPLLSCRGAQTRVSEI